MDNSEIILSVRNLTTRFGHTTAVDGLSFDLHRGETLGIVGESGSGKSVTALSIMGLIKAPGQIHSGSIHFFQDGHDSVLTSLPEAEMRKHRGRDIGLIFQEPFSAFNPSYKCGRQIKESLDLHFKLSPEEAKTRIYKLLKRVGIHDPQRIYQSYPHQLSGGQLQRAMIAMAIVCEPSIIIADEPTTALDVTVQNSVLNLFGDLQNELGSSMIFISHDLGVISQIADRVLVMYKGRVMESGRTSEIFQNPRHPYTKGLLECRPKMDRSVARLPVVSDFMTVETLNDGDWRVVEKNTSPIASHSQVKKNVSPSDDVLLEAQNLTVRYIDKRSFWGRPISFVEAVKNVNFQVRSGETLGLVGESGSGKSSIGKALLKLVRNVEGQVLYEDKDLVKLTESQMRPLRKELQMIFQDPFSTLNPRMKIGHAIKEVLTVHQYFGDKKQRVLDLLDIVGLGEEHYSRYPHQFSGGQRQRISIARTLAVEPKFIVCDESVSALDVSVQAQVLNLLKDLQAEFGLSYLFISHDLSVVKHMSDRLLVMKEGEMVESGDSEQIYQNPQHEYTRQLIQSIPGQNQNF